MSDNMTFTNLFIASRPAIKIEIDRLEPNEVYVTLLHPSSGSKRFVLNRKDLTAKDGNECDDSQQSQEAEQSGGCDGEQPGS